MPYASKEAKRANDRKRAARGRCMRRVAYRYAAPEGHGDMGTKVQVRLSCDHIIWTGQRRTDQLLHCSECAKGSL